MGSGLLIERGRLWIASVVILTILAAPACGHHPTTPAPTTGLTGFIFRGPITPVCRVDVPCSAPLSGTFGVEQGGKHVADFQTDSEGHFTVWLPTGIYRIMLITAPPLLATMSQVKTVEVGAVGLTEVRLEFDTGIR